MAHLSVPLRGRPRRRSVELQRGRLPSIRLCLRSSYLVVSYETGRLVDNANNKFIFLHIELVSHQLIETYFKKKGTNEKKIEEKKSVQPKFNNDNGLYLYLLAIGDVTGLKG